VSTAPDDTWGQVYGLICEAARIPLSDGHDVGRDLRDGLAILKEKKQIDASMTVPARKKLHSAQRTIPPSKKRT
jgi:hypothetical protein